VKRRTFLKQAAAAGMAAAALAAGGRAFGADPARIELPRIKLGSLEVSRLILGSNPFWGYSHTSGDVDQQMRTYYTDDQIMAVLDDAAACGITTVATPPMPRWIDLHKKYLDRGGRLKLWLAQPDGPASGIKAEIAAAVKGGAAAVLIQGHRVEEQFERGQFDLIKEWLEYIKSLGVPAGLAAHRPDIHPEIERRGLPSDFYFQCFYNLAHSDAFRDEDRTKAVETIASITAKPVVAYKILAAGRNPPAEAFAYAFAHLKPKDGVCVGVFPRDKTGQVREDATLAARTVAGA
jgi:hypothetical protein